MTVPMLKRGSHRQPEDGVCAMEAVAWIAGEPHSDQPKCCDPVIGMFMRRWNDSLPDAERDLLVPLLPQVVGTRRYDDGTTELRRSWMAFDWLVRTHAPAWMMLSERLEHHAQQLRALPEIQDRASRTAAMPVVAAAWDAARAAAWAAARDAARDAAWDAAWAAAWDAAWAAARDALEPTKRELQQSACDLVLRMVMVAPGSPPMLAVEECPYLEVAS